MDIDKVILNRIDILRKEKGYSVFKLTELSNLSENTIYNWYNKGAEPSLTALNSVCNILGTSLSLLFAKNEEEYLNAQKDEFINDFKKLSDNQKKLICSLIREFNSENNV